MSAFYALVRLLRVYREARPGSERARALRAIRDAADEEAAREDGPGK